MAGCRIFGNNPVALTDTSKVSVVSAYIRQVIGGCMLKEDIVNKLSNSPTCYGLSKKRIKSILDEALQIITDSFTAGEGILLRGFGQFKVTFQEPYLINHPASGKQVMSHPRFKVLFEPARNVKRKLRTDGSPEIQPEN